MGDHRRLDELLELIRGAGRYLPDLLVASVFDGQNECSIWSFNVVGIQLAFALLVLFALGCRNHCYSWFEKVDRVEVIVRVLVSHVHGDRALIVIANLRTGLSGVDVEVGAADSVVRFLVTCRRPPNPISLEESYLTTEPPREHIVEDDEDDVKGEKEGRFERFELASYDFCRELHLVLF